ncbi:hypothetical protein BHU16_09930 [Tannerella sp. oral taxon 808]|nr:hypothetical protein BHU16_09930 [Tannerella sp. oral taxon 808]
MRRQIALRNSRPLSAILFRAGDGRRAYARAATVAPHFRCSAAVTSVEGRVARLEARRASLPLEAALDGQRQAAVAVAAAVGPVAQPEAVMAAAVGPVAQQEAVAAAAAGPVAQPEAVVAAVEPVARQEAVGVAAVEPVAQQQVVVAASVAQRQAAVLAARSELRRSEPSVESAKTAVVHPWFRERSASAFAQESAMLWVKEKAPADRSRVACH